MYKWIQLSHTSKTFWKRQPLPTTNYRQCHSLRLYFQHFMPKWIRCFCTQFNNKTWINFLKIEYSLSIKRPGCPTFSRSTWKQINWKFNQNTFRSKSESTRGYKFDILLIRRNSFASKQNKCIITILRTAFDWNVNYK